MKKTILLIACATLASCATHLPTTEDKLELEGLNKKVAEAKSLGAERCAPAELAKAEVKALYAAHEIEEGGNYNMDEAQALIAEGLDAAQAAKTKCTAKKEKLTPVAKPKPNKPKAKAKPTVQPIRSYTNSEVIDLKGINFESNKATLTASSKETLDQAVLILKKRANIQVEVAAHTDSGGKASYNEYLSGLRANAVKDYLVSHGIEASRVTAKGYGEAYPIADNRTREGRAKNRRVELIVK